MIERTNALKGIEQFIGVWSGTARTQGMNPESSQTFEWLSGNHFLLNRSVMDFGGMKLEATRFLGFDESNQEFVMHSVDSLGYDRTYRGTLSNGALRLCGSHERIRIEVDANGKLLTRWEQAADGWDWQLLCEICESK